MSNVEELQGLLDEGARKAEVPGAVVGVRHDGKESVFATGVSSVDTGLPVDPGTLFMIGSTSKTFAGAALLALVEDGSLELDKPVAEYLPELRLSDPVAQKTVTTRHLLTHSAGFLGDVDLDSGWGDDALALAVERFAELPQIFPVGEVFSYCNAGFQLAGRVAEAVSGKTFEDLVRTRLLEPLGMTRSYYLPWEVLTRRHAVGHIVTDGEAAVAHTVGLTRADSASGGLWSTAGDQLKWARFFLTGESEGEAPLSAATRDFMRKPQRKAALRFEEVGLSWLHTTHGAARLVRHGGNVSNLQLSEFVTLPEHDFAVTVLTNSAGGAALGRQVVDWCLENLVGLPEVASAPPLPSPALAEYTGRYETGQLAYEFTDRDGVLWAQMVADVEGFPSPPPFEAVFVSEDAIAPAADTRRPAARFLRNDHGEVTLVEFGGRTAKRRATVTG
ncbi:serine hydrolase domain-containing protein [Amycolatopsis azurea]|uniref:Beta-lactamase n=1 Tax=Amycolatopsis azurea DSM 43854 TaxID=1238180 RepID=M2Q984_9PSEU|nr:serine hydrolase domain-containing protein [Amycolatopsis azurea]EMD28525.1 Beta-lactamase [Amycolatopsis azurea DSM 43854]OOC02191.1 serine hydrolase [Amycolatopsis azurea DSM 43854]